MLTLLSAIAIAAAPIPAGADVECVINILPKPAAAALATAMMSASPEPSEAVLKPLVEALQSCGTRLKWKGDHGGTVAGLTVASLMGSEAEMRLQKAGVSVKPIDTWFQQQSEAVQTRIEISDADGERLSAALAEAGVSEEKLDAHSEMIGTYIGTLIIFKRVEKGLPLD